jgi:cytochrome P450
MSTLLAAAETSEARKDLRPATAAALGALQAALSDMAVDLDAIAADSGPQEDEWRRYLAGDRAVFARKLAAVIDTDAVHRIATLYRENARFRDSANTYMQEFEAMLTRARDGDGGGLLASSILSADTGKIYLAIAYALGRL